MDERSVIRQSYSVFSIGCVIFLIIGIILKDLSFLLGFILGYLLNLLVFNVIIKVSESILELSLHSIFVFFSFLIRLGIYAMGFYAAIKLPWFHLLGVFIGYLVIKISILVDGYKNKGGEG